MLGGLLSRQEAAEEEVERQLREQQEQQQHVAAEKRGVNTSNNNQYGSLSASAASNGGEDIIVEEGSGKYQHAVDENDVYREEDHSDTEGDYYYDDEDTEDDDHSYEESSFDSDVDNHDENEDSYLLDHSSTQQRRRRRQRKKKKPEGFSLKRTLKRLGSKIRSAVVAIADVDNVWDSPDAANHQRHGQNFGGAYSEDPSSNSNNIANEKNNNASMILYNVITGGTSTRNRTAAIFWFIFLSTSYASERSTFKLLVDRVGPFRLFSAELILGTHALFTAMGMLIGHFFFRKEKKEHEGNSFGLGIPLADVGCEFFY